MLIEHWTDIESHDTLESGIPKRDPSLPREYIARVKVDTNVTSQQLEAWFKESNTNYLILAIAQNDGTEVYYKVNKGLESIKTGE